MARKAFPTVRVRTGRKRSRARRQSRESDGPAGKPLELGGGGVLLASRKVRKLLAKEAYELIGLQSAADGGDGPSRRQNTHPGCGNRVARERTFHN
eukprot:6357895-Pyramimonas_sp.AAC.1